MKASSAPTKSSSIGALAGLRRWAWFAVALPSGVHSTAHKRACTCNRPRAASLHDCTRFEIFEFIRKLLLIGVLTAVSESSQAYLNVAHAVSFFSLLIFAKCQPFVDPKLDRCGWDTVDPRSARAVCSRGFVALVHCAFAGRRTFIRTTVEVCSSCRLQMCAHAVTCLTIFVGIVQVSASFGSATDPSESSVQARPCALPTLRACTPALSVLRVRHYRRSSVCRAS